MMMHMTDIMFKYSQKENECRVHMHEWTNERVCVCYVSGEVRHDVNGWSVHTDAGSFGF
jgi:hypothetical protein